MAASNYIATKAERDDFDRVLGIERKHIAWCRMASAREIRQIFAAKGFSGEDLERIVTMITSDRAFGQGRWRWKSTGFPRPRDHPRWPRSAPLLHPLCAASCRSATYLSAGGLASCVAAAGATFFGVGAIKSRWSPTAWWRSGLESLTIGMSAAAWRLRSVTA